MLLYKQGLRKSENKNEKTKGSDTMTYNNLEAELKRNNITREKLAEILDITIGSTSLKMTGKFDFTLGEAKTIAKTLGNSIDFLFSEQTA